MSARIYRGPEHSRILGVVCSQCGHEENIDKVSYPELESKLSEAEEALENAADTIEYGYMGCCSCPETIVDEPYSCQFCKEMVKCEAAARAYFAKHPRVK